MTAAQPARKVRRRLDPRSRVEELLQVAAAVFETTPYDEVSVEDIAATAGASPALVHHYFGSKRGLFLAVVQQAVELFVAVLQLPAADPDPRARLRRALDAYLDFVSDRPQGYTFLLASTTHGDGEIGRRVVEARAAVHRIVLEILGLPRPTPSQSLRAWGWIGYVEATVSQWLREPAVSRRTLIRMLLDAADLIA